MKEYRKGEPALLFKTLSDPTRLRLLNLLAGGETCVCELTDTLRIVQPKVSRHLAQLKRAGLVDARREGKWMHYRVVEPKDRRAAQVLRNIREWLATDREMQKDRSRLVKLTAARMRTDPQRDSRPGLLVHLALAAADFAFDRRTRGHPSQITMSLLVVHKGDIVLERYAPGVDFGLS